MNTEELISFLKPPRRSVDVDVSAVHGVDGELRVTTVESENRVSIQYVTVQEYLSQSWEPGLVYRGTYSDLNSLISALEKWLCKPLLSWRNFTLNPLSELEISQIATMTIVSYEENANILRDMVRSHVLSLPEGTEFRITSVYWRQIERYGNWDVKRALEDQTRELEEMDRSRGEDPL